MPTQKSNRPTKKKKWYIKGYQTFIETHFALSPFPLDDLSARLQKYHGKQAPSPKKIEEALNKLSDLGLLAQAEDEGQTVYRLMSSSLPTNWKKKIYERIPVNSTIDELSYLLGCPKSVIGPAWEYLQYLKSPQYKIDFAKEARASIQSMKNRSTPTQRDLVQVICESFGDRSATLSEIHDQLLLAGFQSRRDLLRVALKDLVDQGVLGVNLPTSKKRGATFYLGETEKQA